MSQVVSQAGRGSEENNLSALIIVFSEVPVE